LDSDKKALVDIFLCLLLIVGIVIVGGIGVAILLGAAKVADKWEDFNE
jgi:hypothetical protein